MMAGAQPEEPEVSGRGSNVTWIELILPSLTWLQFTTGSGSFVTFVWRSNQVSTSDPLTKTLRTTMSVMICDMPRMRSTHSSALAAWPSGAAGLLLMSERAAAAGVEPLARHAGTAAAGVHPDYMGIGPVPAMTKALARAGWQADSLDLAEVNEAFAAQAVAVINELKLDPGRVNVNGGAIAIGHPLGCSGARISTALLHEFRRRGATRAAATMCIGVGQGIATLWAAS